jgi:ABC-type multidrug transport system fused ATPase/permease subunit
MFIIGGATWLLAFLYQTFLAIFAENTSRKLKVAYLKAIFSQDASWFDNTNYTELAASLAKQTHSIQRGVGDKVGTLIMASGSVICGLGLGFYYGPLYALCLLGFGPPLIFVMAISMSLMTSSASKSIKAYG